MNFNTNECRIYTLFGLKMGYKICKLLYHNKGKTWLNKPFNDYIYNINKEEIDNQIVLTTSQSNIWSGHVSSETLKIKKDDEYFKNSNFLKYGIRCKRRNKI